MEKDHLEVLREDIRGKFDLVLEGHGTLLQRMDRLAEESKERDEHLLFLIQTLDRKIDGVDALLSARMDAVETKIDGVAVDLSAHRRDTEAHGGVYQVKERG